MSYFEYFVIGWTVLSLLCGLIGRARNKIIKLFNMVLAIVAAYFLTVKIAMPKIMSADFASVAPQLGITVTEGTPVTAGDLLMALLGKVPQLASLAENDEFRALLVNGSEVIIRVIVFWVMGFVLMILLGIIGAIFSAIIKNKQKNYKAVRTLGIPGMVRGFIFSIFLIFPVIALSPIIKAVPEVMESMAALTSEGEGGGSEALRPHFEDAGSTASSEESDDTFNKVLNLVIEQFNKSKVVELGYKAVDKLEMLTYEAVIDGQKVKVNFAEKIVSLIDSVKGASQFMGLFEAFGDADPAEALAKMDPEQIEQAFAAIAENQDLIVSVAESLLGESLDSMLPEGLDLSEIDFAQEGAAIAQVVTLMNPDFEGEINYDELAADLAGSELVQMAAGIEGLEGAIELPQAQIDSIEQSLTALTQGPEATLTAEEAQAILAMFGAKTE